MSPDWLPAYRHLQNDYHALQMGTAEASAAVHLVDTAFAVDIQSLGNEHADGPLDTVADTVAVAGAVETAVVQTAAEETVAVETVAMDNVVDAVDAVAAVNYTDYAGAGYFATAAVYEALQKLDTVKNSFAKRTGPGNPDVVVIVANPVTTEWVAVEEESLQEYLALLDKAE